tara:strand:- start:307 stop:513 length:207 start_codon:yes stop_codon:yes gene_type:complete
MSDNLQILLDLNNQIDYINKNLDTQSDDLKILQDNITTLQYRLNSLFVFLDSFHEKSIVININKLKIN